MTIIYAMEQGPYAPLTKEECEREGIIWWGDRVIYDENGNQAIINYPNKIADKQVKP